jgi:hypothetical protein
MQAPAITDCFSFAAARRVGFSVMVSSPFFLEILSASIVNREYMRAEVGAAAPLHQN